MTLECTAAGGRGGRRTINNLVTGAPCRLSVCSPQPPDRQLGCAGLPSGSSALCLALAGRKAAQHQAHAGPWHRRPGERCSCWAHARSPPHPCLECACRLATVLTGQEVAAPAGTECMKHQVLTRALRELSPLKWDEAEHEMHPSGALTAYQCTQIGWEQLRSGPKGHSFMQMPESPGFIY